MLRIQILTLYACVLSACSISATPVLTSEIKGNITTTTLSIATNAPEGTMTSEQTIMKKMTSTSIPPSRTPTITTYITPLPTPTPLIDARYTTNCAQIIDWSPNQDPVDGLVIIVGQPKLKDSFLLNLKTSEKHIILLEDREYVEDSYVSPGSILFAYSIWNELTDKLLIEVINNKGHKQTSFFASQDWFSLDGWLNDENIIISKKDLSSTDNIVRLNGLIILDPFTMKSQRINIDDFADALFPDDIQYWGMKWGIVPPLVLSPDLNFVVYPKDYKVDSEQAFGISLWDVENKRELVFLKYAEVTTPSWSPDGQVVAMVKSRYPIGSSIYDHEIYSIDLLGNIKQLTYLNEYLDEVMLENLNWSPDGKHLAFRLKSEDTMALEGLYENIQTQGTRLAVLDMQNEKVIDFCIPINSVPYWSPDGKHLLFANYKNDLTAQIYILNVKNGNAMKVYEDQYIYPRGWMSGPENSTK